MASQLKKTVMPSGGDYTSLEACMNANEQNLVTADKYFDVEIDGTWSSADTSAVNIYNYTTDATRYINIYTTSAARHHGVYSTSYYMIKLVNNDYYQTTVSMGNNYTILDGVQIDSTANYHGGTCIGDNASDGNSYLTIKNCLLKIYKGGESIGGNRCGINFVYRIGGCKVYNNFIYAMGQNSGSDGIFGIYVIQYSGEQGYVYNNTFYFSDCINVTGILCHSGMHLRNNLVMGATTCYSGTPHSDSTNNLASDTTTPEYNTYYDSKAITFIDGANGDLHLASGDTDAIDKGTSSVDSLFTDDIDGVTRTGTWDIGADEYGVGYPKYTKQDIITLPAADTDLSGTFSAQNYTDVSSDNDQYVDQISNGQYAMFLFKDQYTFQSNITVTWIGKSDRAPSTSLVKLQIYDRDGTTWEDLDEENGVGAGTEFTLTGTITSDLDHYYDADFVISCRVYQQAI